MLNIYLINTLLQFTELLPVFDGKGKLAWLLTEHLSTAVFLLICTKLSAKLQVYKYCKWPYQLMLKNTFTLKQFSSWNWLHALFPLSDPLIFFWGRPWFSTNWKVTTTVVLFSKLRHQYAKVVCFVAGHVISVWQWSAILSNKI